MAHKVAFLPAYYAYAPLTLTGCGGGRGSGSIVSYAGRVGWHFSNQRQSNHCRLMALTYQPQCQLL